jgi:hypothetical protein
LGSANVVRRCHENDFTCHPTPCMMHHIRHGNMATISQMGLMIAVGTPKAQDSKAKPVYGSKPPRATRVKEEETQRMANILAHPVPHRGDPTSSSFVSDSILGGFLHAPMWAGI